MDQRARPPAFLVAPDSFKGTFDAPTAAAAIGSGLEAAGASVDSCPLADGGEGTMEVLAGALEGRILPALAHDPLGREIDATYAMLGDGRAVVETARASGLTLVGPDERDAERASTFGTGELIVAAARAGASTVIVAAGGSAATDGGAGALDAIRQAGGIEGVALEVLCDVRTAFGDAAPVFGPQKGADAAAVRRLGERLEALASSLPRDPRGVEMTGAAGGLAGGRWAELGAKLRGGADAVIEAVGFERRLASADAVVSGEGRLDLTSLEGKVVGAVADRCRRAGVSLDVVAGSVDRGFDPAALGAHSVAIASTLSELEAAGAALARECPA
ncbi:MAG: glycerate kinase family protein [Solirubrobacterales bacterium]